MIPGDGAEARARRAWADLHDSFMLRRGGGQLLVMDGQGDQAGICPLRPLAQVLAAALDLDRLDARPSIAASEPIRTRTRGRVRRPARTSPSLDELADKLELYRWGDGYADYPGTDTVSIADNTLVALDALQAHMQLSPPVADSLWLHKAKRTFEVVAAEGPDHRDAAAVELALRLHLATGIERFLSIATQIDQIDQVEQTDQVDVDQVDVDHGASVGAEVLWWRVTQDRTRLDRAVALGAAALDRLAAADRLWRRAPVDNATLFVNLLLVHGVESQPRVLAELDRYLERVWREARDPATGQFTAGGIGRTHDRGHTLDHAAIVQLFARQAFPADPT